MAMTGGIEKLVYTGYGAGRNDFPIRLYVYYKTTQSINANQSTILCGMYVTTPSTAYDIGSWTDSRGSYVGTSSLTFDGSIPNFAGTRWLVENKSFVVNHEADGSGTATIHWKWGVNSSWAGIQNISGSFVINLPKIPRISKPTLSVSTVDFGSNITINTNRASGDFTHKLWYKYGSTSWIEIADNIATSHVWTVPKSLMNAIPDSTSLSITIACDTYYGGAYMGYDVAVLKATVPNSTDCFPSITNISWTKSSSEPAAWPMTQHVSKGTVAMTGVSLAYGSPIKSYSLTFAGYSSTAASLSIPNIASSGSLKAVAKVTDSRERSFIKEVFFAVTPYTKPQLDVSAAYRSNAQGVEDISGEYLYIKATASVATVSTNSLKSLTLQYKKRSDSSYTSVALTNGTARLVALSSDYTWDWIVTASDAVNTVSSNGSIPTGAVVFDIMANGKGIAFGKVAEGEGFDCGWPMKIQGSPMADYVVEQGTSGIWIYRKWASGIAECWGVTDAITQTTSTDWNVMTSNTATPSISYPFTFKNSPVVSPSVHIHDGNFWLVTYGAGSTTKTPTYQIARGKSSTTITFKLGFHVFGQWK